MKFQFRRHKKAGPLPAWPFIGLGVGLLAGLGGLLSLVPDRWIPPCGFHVMTGHPCPSCGGTRMSQLLLKGQVVDAIRMNPFFALIILGLSLWFLTGAVARLAGRDFRIEVGRGEEKWIWLALGAAFLLNWAYLWRAGI